MSVNIILTIRQISSPPKYITNDTMHCTFYPILSYTRKYTSYWESTNHTFGVKRWRRPSDIPVKVTPRKKKMIKTIYGNVAVTYTTYKRYFNFKSWVWNAGRSILRMITRTHAVNVEHFKRIPSLKTRSLWSYTCRRESKRSLMQEQSSNWIFLEY